MLKVAAVSVQRDEREANRYILHSSESHATSGVDGGVVSSGNKPVSTVCQNILATVLRMQ
jgi:hypothetical protein